MRNFLFIYYFNELVGLKIYDDLYLVVFDAIYRFTWPIRWTIFIITENKFISSLCSIIFSLIMSLVLNLFKPIKFNWLTFTFLPARYMAPSRSQFPNGRTLVSSKDRSSDVCCPILKLTKCTCVLFDLVSLYYYINTSAY